MSQRLFLVDVENTGRSPHSGVLTEFGVVEFESQKSFYGHLYDTMPSPENPAIPVLAGPGPNLYVQVSTDPQQVTVPDTTAMFTMLSAWVASFGGSRAVFVSDNPGHDWMFFTYTCDEAGVDNPFGHSSRRIGDLAAGLKGKWRDTSSWKRYRRTKHTHHPVDDAMGNAEALRTVLLKHGQIEN